MSKDGATDEKSLKDKVKDRVKPPPSQTSEVRARALETLVALLDSDEESVRLQAAQAILQHAKEPEKSRPGAKVVKKLVPGGRA